LAKNVAFKTKPIIDDGDSKMELEKLDRGHLYSGFHPYMVSEA